MSIMGRINGRKRTSVVRGELRRKLSLGGAVPTFVGGGMDVRVHYLSTTGMLLETTAPLSVGEPIELLLPEDARCAAMIVWANESIFACQFDRALSTAAISAIKLQSPHEQRVVEAGAEQFRTDDDAEETLGARIKRLRQERGFSMVRLAAGVGVSKPTLWKWETDAVRPRQDTVRALAKMLGVSEMQLLYGSRRQISQRGERVNAALQVAEEVIAASKVGIADIFGVDPSCVRIVIEA